jgi:two-component system catabolic regulation response regulator CreB/two-component system response regulator ChvI
MKDNIRILIVDDEPDIALTLKMGLETYSYEVIAYSNPKKAIEDFKSHSYDLLLIDIRMPEMSGFELYTHLRKKDKDFKICFMTSFETYYRSLIEFFPTIDVDCFIKKPITTEELNSHISKELKK